MPTFLFALFVLAQVLDTHTVEALTSQNVVISNGSLSGDENNDNGVVYSLTGNNFAAQQISTLHAFSFGPTLQLVGTGFAVTGSPLDMSATVNGTAFDCPGCTVPVITVNGTVFQPPTADFSMHWNFSSVMVSVPSFCNGCSAPFNFNGTLEVRQSGTPIFELTLTGSGLAFPRLTGVGTPQNPIEVHGVIYDFVPTAVPEPTSVALLLGPGVALLARRMAQVSRRGKFPPYTGTRNHRRAPGTTRSMTAPIRINCIEVGSGIGCGRSAAEIRKP